MARAGKPELLQLRRHRQEPKSRYRQVAGQPVEAIDEEQLQEGRSRPSPPWAPRFLGRAGIKNPLDVLAAAVPRRNPCCLFPDRARLAPGKTEDHLSEAEGRGWSLDVRADPCPLHHFACCCPGGAREAPSCRLGKGKQPGDLPRLQRNGHDGREAQGKQWSRGKRAGEEAVRLGRGRGGAVPCRLPPESGH